MEELLDAIYEADSAQIDILLEAVMDRKQTLYPNWDLIYIALPAKDPDEYNRALDSAIEELQRYRRGIEE